MLLCFPPAGGITPAMFGAPVSEKEAEDLSKSERKFCSGSKLKEMTGSGIFAENSENDDSEASNPANKTSVRMYQQTVTGISQISFSADGSVSPKKPSSLPEVAKQRELSGTLETDAEAKMNKQHSEAKSKELSGSDIFGPPPEIPARPLAARNMELQGNLDFALPQPRSVHTSVKVSNAFVIEYRTTAPIFCRLNNLLVRYAKKEFIPPFFRKPQLQKGPFLLFLLVIQDIHTPYREWMLKLGCIDIGPAGGPSNITFSEEPVVKTSKKIHNQKFQELTGNNIFKEDATPASAEKSLSSAKLKEMSGSDIFADGAAAPRDYLGGVRKPPGGESSIALI
ncbi:hypothetical protein OsJ_15020 [Oryza sativa Japonica Group]|uniref:DUF4057 domain-containing protein n=1 Tax=Oryza sativa subsp. japonica TaxID=39947 RepID=B9FFH6_ORYSJ|nr:hypothetical protein OsJ_15020 [Oryza sativa Japonica Group]